VLTRPAMLNELIVVALILLILGHALLIRGCFDIKNGLMPVGDLPGGLDDVRTILRQSSDALEFIAETLADSPLPQTDAGSNSSVLGALISSMLMPSNHASEELQGSVRQVERTPTPDNAQDQPDERP